MRHSISHLVAAILATAFAFGAAQSSQVPANARRLPPTLSEDQILSTFDQRTIQRYRSEDTYLCDPTKPDESFRLGLERVAIDEKAFQGKDENGLYNRSGLTYFGRPIDEEITFLFHRSADSIVPRNEYDQPSIKYTYELLINELWSRNKACVIWVSPMGVVQVREISLAKTDAARLRYELGVSSGSNDQGAPVNLTPQSARERLSEGIFPADLDLSNADRIVIRGGGTSSQFPFSALTYKGKPAGAQFALLALFGFDNTYEPLVPRAQVPFDDTVPSGELSWLGGAFADLTKDPGEYAKSFKSALVVANPTPPPHLQRNWLPIDSSETEGKSVARIMDTILLFTQKNASRTNIRSLLRDADYIHISTHGLADKVNPISGSVALLSDGTYGARNLKADVGFFQESPIVVLSACQLALGKPFEGGTYGLTRTFLRMGAGQVVSHLWNVESARNSRHMTELAFRVANGQGTEFAIRDIIRAAYAKDPDTPSYWASMIASGTPSYNCRGCN